MIVLYGLAALGVYLIVYGAWLEFLDDFESGRNKELVVYPIDELIFLNHMRTMGK